MSLQQLLGVDLPIVQAPMAGSQDAALAAAVSNAGGLGSLPCALLSPQQTREQLALLRSQTSRAFNVNFFCHAPPVAAAEREERWRAALAPYYEEYGVDTNAIPASAGRAPFSSAAAELLREARPAVVSFHFGLPAPELVDLVKQLGSMVFASATTVAEAVWLEKRGADAVIAQGLEAGGHRGIFLSDDLTTQVGTFALLPQIVKHVRVPVIAAGGIADAKGVATALALGAAAVQVGTAYLLCPEATTSAVHRAALKSDGASHTAVTNVFTGRPARGIMNRAMRELGPISASAPEFPLAAAAIVPLRAKAEMAGRGDFSPLWAGQNITGCKEVPAAQLTRELALV
jgi:nitronate monooxygenase